MIYQGIKRKGLDGAGRKPLDELMEEVLVECIYKRREKRLWDFQKLLMKKLSWSTIKSKRKKLKQSNNRLSRGGCIGLSVEMDYPGDKIALLLKNTIHSWLIRFKVSHVLHAPRFTVEYNYPQSL